MPEIIRTDKWVLNSTLTEREVLQETVRIYRRYVRFLMVIVNHHWKEIQASQTPQGYVEKLIHQTKQNPNPKYSKFLGKETEFYKFPSYYRRSAINEAIGAISSFNTRYRQWQGGIRLHKSDRSPKLTTACQIHPDLYQGQCVKFGENWQTVQIKVRQDSDWKWLTLKVKHQRNRHLDARWKRLSPTLIVTSKKVYLSIPFQSFEKYQDFNERVCGADLGVNTTIVASVIDSKGVVHNRTFIHEGKALDKRDKHLARIRRKARLTMGSGGKLAKGFAKVNYRKAGQINKNMARQVARKLVNFALENQATVIVFENLNGWKPKGGKKRSTLKQRFHGWLKCAIVKRVEELALEKGIRVKFVNARGTSKYAYDGSGQVTRNPKNYSIAKFKSGKIYPCDLSASYNIGAKYLVHQLTRKNGKLSSGKKSRGKPRSRVTLSTLWERETTTTASA